MALCDHGLPAVGPVITQNSGPTGNAHRAASQGPTWSQAQPSMPDSRRLSPLPWRTRTEPRTGSRSDSTSASASPIRSPAPPEHDDESSHAVAGRATTGGAHHGDDLLDAGRVCWVAAALVARRAAGEVAGQGGWRAGPTDRIEQNGRVQRFLLAGASPAVTHGIIAGAGLSEAGRKQKPLFAP